MSVKICKSTQLLPERNTLHQNKLEDSTRACFATNGLESREMCEQGPTPMLRLRAAA